MPFLNLPDENYLDDNRDGEPEMEMPTPCDICGEIFDLNDGHPCHRCNIVFCQNCARATDEGWRCDRCMPTDAELP